VEVFETSSSIIECYVRLITCFREYFTFSKMQKNKIKTYLHPCVAAIDSVDLIKLVAHESQDQDDHHHTPDKVLAVRSASDGQVIFTDNIDGLPVPDRKMTVNCNCS